MTPCPERCVFDHDRLDVYRAAVQFVALVEALLDKAPAGRAYLADQLRRAATSITLNIAEGAGEFSPRDKARFYRMARRSATECAAVLDVLAQLRLADEPSLAGGRELLQRIVSMLVRMSQAVEPNRATCKGTGTGTGTGTKSTGAKSIP